MAWLRALAVCAIALVPIAAHAAPTTRWILAEGAANSFFTEDILIGNPNAAAVTVRITLLPQDDSGNPGTPIIIPNFDITATSRYTFHVNAVPNLTSGSLSAVVECVSCTGDQGIVVERTMTWSNAQKRGGHNSQGVLAPATDWFLAEGTVGFFQDFILIANPDPTQTANVQVTYLREFSGPLVQTFTMGPNTRKTIYVNGGVDIGGTTTFLNEPFSTAVHSSNGVGLVVERAMYWNAFEGGHEATAVPTASPTWLFSEGATGGIPTFFWDTFILLANPGDTDANVTLNFFRDAGAPVTCTTAVAAHHRKTVYVNNLDDAVQQITCSANGAANMKSAAFSTKIVSTQPIVAERAMYWTSNGSVWIDGHDTPGVTAEALKWAFAEGTEGRIDASGILYNSFFLFSNASASTLELKATFMREDGTGIVKTYSVAPQSRFTLPTASVLEVGNQRFSAFFESTNSVPFVAERAVYWGDGYYGGHGSTGTPWEGTIAAPPAAIMTPVVSSANISPNHGPIGGGNVVTIEGTGFTLQTTVAFGLNAATGVNVLSPTKLTAIVPAATSAGAVNVSVSNPGYPADVVSGGYTYDPPIVTGTFTTVDTSLAFGDSITFGTITTVDTSSGIPVFVGGQTTPYGNRLRTLMAARYTQQAIGVTVAGVPGECVQTDCGTGTSGIGRLPNLLQPSQDLVIILEGVNDLNAGLSMDNIVNGLRQMVLAARGQGKQVILCGLVPVKARETQPDADPTFWKANPYQVAALNKRIEDLKNELQIPRVNLFSAFGGGDYTTPLQCNQNASCRALLGPDGLHPNDSGYQRIAEAIFQKIMDNFETNTATH